MADSLFDFELLDSADVLVDFDADEALNAVAAAETAQLETDHDEMAILADYVAPPNKTPEDLARDLEAVVTGVNTLSLQATEGTAVVVAPLAAVTTSSPTPPASSSAPTVATAAPPSGMVSSTPSSSPPASSLEPGSRSMGNLAKLPESEAKVPFMCGQCFTSWLVTTASKCLHCGTVGQMVPTALPSASVTVDGVTWTMTFDADQQLRWQSDAVDHGDQQKSACSIEVSSLGQCPPAAAASPSEISFSELVSDSSRLTLRQEVLNRGDDDVFQKPQVAQTPTSTRQRSGPRDSHLPSIQCEGNAPGVRASPSRTA